MIELPYTVDNVELYRVLERNKRKNLKWSEITFTAKANLELQDLVLEYEITVAGY